MLRTLIHHRRMNLAVTAGAAVASAVLTGALLVGDSVRGSLRDLTLERLGGIDQALAGQRFFRRGLAAELGQHPDFGERFAAAAPAILLTGSAQHADSKARASGVGLQGIDGELAALFGAEDPFAGTDAAGRGAPGSIFPPVAINASLQRALGAELGDDLLFSLKRWSEVPRGSLLGRKDTGNVVETLRLRVAAVIPDRGLGRFALAVHQASPYNAFVPLAALADALGQPGKVNSIAVAQRGEADQAAGEELERLLREVLRPEDLGLLLTERNGVLAVESQEFILKPALIETVEALATEHGAATLPMLTYLANAIRIGGGSVPYSTVAAIDTAPDAAFGEIRLSDGSAAPPLGEGEILLNAWAARDLGAAVGEAVELDYFAVGPREDLTEQTVSFEVRGVVALAGLAADPTLSQEYPGIAGSDNMADWDPPFPIDLGAVRAEDEDYWDAHRGTPKAFLAIDTGRRLWRNRWGELTAIRVAAPEPGAALLETFRRELPRRLPLDAFGLSFQPVKALGLGASSGATDFGGLFIGFSFFLILSAALLVALLFSLGIEQRAGEIGLLRAVGYPEATVRRRLLAEGAVLSAAGSLLGLAGAVGFAAAMMRGLRTWWRPAVGTSELYLHVLPASLALGWLISVGVVVLAIQLRVRRLRRVSTPALLAKVAAVRDTRAGRKARLTALVGLAIAAAAIGTAAATGRTTDPMLFGIAGPALLVGLLALFALAIGGGRSAALERPGARAMLRMATVNGSRNRGRSLLSATLVASASFLIVTVAAFQQDFSREELGRDSGTGGYALVAEADVPLQRDLNTPEGRFELAVGDATLAGAHVVPLRLLPGEDTSCLNLYQPTQPRILGVPGELIERGGFLFQGTVREADNPWSLLTEELEPGVIPAFGDANSTQWILKLGLGDDLEMENEHGEPIRLRLVGNLKTSIFQSELLISEEQFLRHFPGQTGWSSFLVEAGAARAEEVGQGLERALADYGLDVVTTGEKLEAFHQVQNTYLSTFRTTGGLGLLLGTVGLAIVLLRNVVERRGELAAMRAFGFRRATLTRLVLAENALLLAAGLVIGTAAALVTAAPHLLSAGAVVPWRAIFATLAVILSFGLAACAAASVAALRAPLLPALKAEH